MATSLNPDISSQRVLIIGAGLAGAEAAHFLANKQVPVVLYEIKQLEESDDGETSGLGELICSNSLKSNDAGSAHGMLKHEMRGLGSLVIRAAEQFAVPAGSALAVDRHQFSRTITKTLGDHPLIELVVGAEVSDPVEVANQHGCSHTIIASGPITSQKLGEWIAKEAVVNSDNLYFYDSIAPVVNADSLDVDLLYYKDRHQESVEGQEADYLNIPLDREEYLQLVDQLVKATKVPPNKFETPKFFEGCMPIDLLAERGVDTLRFSCMKPVGLEQSDGRRPYAVIQLRRENLLGSAFNLVGFQNRLTHSEQLRIFRQIKGMEEATFLKLGSVHRNTYINAKESLDYNMQSKQIPQLFFAGQMTGVEGYTESASMGLYVAYQLWQQLVSPSEQAARWPCDTAIGALVNYIMTWERPTPSNINFGLMPPVELPAVRGKKRWEIKKLKKGLVAKRAGASFDQFLAASMNPGESR
jgi:methylenetetrahydrofolate--tRNA-(uracil-5-)-methyltransferase